MSHRWKVLGVVMIGTFMAALDSSIVNVSIPAMMGSFHARVAEIEWVVTSYMLAFATLMPLTAWVRDRIGYKALYLASLGVFTLGSLACGLAGSLPLLIAARVLQALGGGAITPTGMAMVSEVFEPRERGRALGYWGLGVVVGPTIGPTLGGFLTSHFGWRSIFTVNIPVGAVGLLLGWVILKADRPPAGSRVPFDFGSFLTLTLFIVAFLLGLSLGGEQGWSSPVVLIFAALAVAGFAGFLVTSARAERGIVDLGLFRLKEFTIAAVVTCVRSVVLFGSTFLLPLYLQGTRGLTEQASGLVMLPGALILGLTMPVAGRLVDRVGPRLPVLWGILLITAFLVMFGFLGIDTPLWLVILPTLVRGLGVGLLVTPIIAAAMNAVPRRKTGMASSMLNVVQQMSGSLGIALLAIILDVRTRSRLDVVAQVSGLGRDALEAGYHSLLQQGGRALSLGSGMETLLRQASVAAFDDTYLVSAAFIALALIPAWALPRGRAAAVPEVHEVVGD